MEKILPLFAIALPLFLHSCSGDDMPSNLNTYEKALVGSYIEETKDSTEMFYLVLDKYKTGSIIMKNRGKIKESATLQWSATQDKIITKVKSTLTRKEIIDTTGYILQGNTLIAGEITYRRQ